MDENLKTPDLKELTEKIQTLTELVYKLVYKDQKQEMDSLLTTKKASELINRSEETLKRWRKENSYLKYVKKGGRYFYIKSDLLNYLARNSKKGEGIKTSSVKTL